MYDILNEKPDSHSGFSGASKASYLRSQLSYNLQRVYDYYSNHNTFIESDHFLVRLLQSLPVAKELTIDQYAYLISDKLDEITAAFDITSSTNYGKPVSEPVLLGDCTEVIIGHKEHFNKSTLKDGWEKLKPIRFLTHPNSDYGLNLHHLRYSGGNTGIAVISINIPMLACQYRLWKESVKDLEDIPTTMQFVSRTLITNTLESYYHISLLNGFYDHLFDEDHGIVMDDHPFYLNHYEDEIKKLIKGTFKLNLGKRLSFAEFLDGVELIDDNSLMQAVTLPKVPPTRQVVWGLVIARLKVTLFLLKYDELSEGNLNRQEIINIKRTLKQLKSDKGINNLLERKDSEEILSTLFETIFPKVK